MNKILNDDIIEDFGEKRKKIMYICIYKKFVFENVGKYFFDILLGCL